MKFWKASNTKKHSRTWNPLKKMLSALESVVQYHREHDSGAGELFGLDYVTTCIAAIAKARGQ